MVSDELQAAIDRAVQKRDALLADQPAAKESAKVIAALPALAKQYRDQTTKGLQGDMVEPGRRAWHHGSCLESGSSWLPQRTGAISLPVRASAGRCYCRQ